MNKVINDGQLGNPPSTRMGTWKKSWRRDTIDSLEVCAFPPGQLHQDLVFYFVFGYYEFDYLSRILPHPSLDSWILLAINCGISLDTSQFTGF